MADIDDAPNQPRPRLSAPVPLTIAHDLSAFDCGEPVLNDWLRQRALKNESRFSRTYVVCEGNQVVGYFCVSAGAVERAAAPGKVRRNAPDTIPVSVIDGWPSAAPMPEGGSAPTCFRTRCAGSRWHRRASASARFWFTPRTMRPNASICAAPNSSSIPKTAGRCSCRSKR